MLVALNHGVQLPQYAGGLGVFFFGLRERFGGLLIFTGWVALRGGEVALVFLIHAGKERGIIAGDLFFGQARFALQGAGEARNADGRDGLAGVVLAHKEGVDKRAVQVLREDALQLIIGLTAGKLRRPRGRNV